MSKRETTLALAAADTPTTTERDRDRAKLADLGLAGAGGETAGYVPNEDHRLDDRLDPNEDEIAQAVDADVAGTDCQGGDKTRTHTEPKFAFVSPTDEDFELHDGERAQARAERLAHLNAELDEPLPAIAIHGSIDEEEADRPATVERDDDTVRAFAYYEGPCGSTIVSPPVGYVREPDEGQRLTVIESPLAGNVALNVAYAKAAMMDCFERGEAPFASHLLYAQSGLLDDASPIERGRGIIAGLEWGRFADRCAVYTDLGISSGMGLGIASAQSHGVRIEFRTLGEAAVRDLMESYGQP